MNQNNHSKMSTYNLEVTGMHSLPGEIKNLILSYVVPTNYIDSFTQLCKTRKDKYIKNVMEYVRLGADAKITITDPHSRSNRIDLLDYLIEEYYFDEIRELITRHGVPANRKINSCYEYPIFALIQMSDEYACAYQMNAFYNIFELLLDNGANVNQQNRYGIIPIQAAIDLFGKYAFCYENDGISEDDIYKFIRQLIEKGADLTYQDERGNDVLNLLSRMIRMYPGVNGRNVYKYAQSKII